MATGLGSCPLTLHDYWIGKIWNIKYFGTSDLQPLVYLVSFRPILVTWLSARWVTAVHVGWKTTSKPNDSGFRVPYYAVWHASLYVVFAWCVHNTAHFVHNPISGLTCFVYFRIIVSLQVTVVVRSPKDKVSGPFCVMLSLFLGCLNFWGHLYFWGRLNFRFDSPSPVR